MNQTQTKSTKRVKAAKEVREEKDVDNEFKKEIRNIRLKQLADTRYGGSRTAIAKACGINMHLMARYIRNEKAIGEHMKDKIEERLDLPHNWLDGDETTITLKIQNKDLWLMMNHLLTLPKEDIDRFRQIYELTLGTEFKKLAKLDRRVAERKDRRKCDSSTYAGPERRKDERRQPRTCFLH